MAREDSSNTRTKDQCKHFWYRTPRAMQCTLCRQIKEGRYPRMFGRKYRISQTTAEYDRLNHTPRGSERTEDQP